MNKNCNDPASLINYINMLGTSEPFQEIGNDLIYTFSIYESKGGLGYKVMITTDTRKNRVDSWYDVFCENNKPYINIGGDIYELSELVIGFEQKLKLMREGYERNFQKWQPR